MEHMFTDSLLSAIAVHMFCNRMGLPNLSSLWELSARTRQGAPTVCMVLYRGCRRSMRVSAVYSDPGVSCAWLDSVYLHDGPVCLISRKNSNNGDGLCMGLLCFVPAWIGWASLQTRIIDVLSRREVIQALQVCCARWGTVGAWHAHRFVHNVIVVASNPGGTVASRFGCDVHRLSDHP